MARKPATKPKPLKAVRTPPTALVPIKLEDVPVLVDLDADLNKKELRFCEYYFNAVSAEKKVTKEDGSEASQTAQELHLDAILTAGRRAGYEATGPVMQVLGRRILQKFELSKDNSELMTYVGLGKIPVILAMKEIAMDSKQTGQARSLVLGHATKCHGMQKDVVDSRGARVIYYEEAPACQSGGGRKKGKKIAGDDDQTITITGQVQDLCPLCKQGIFDAPCGPAHKIMAEEMRDQGDEDV